MSYYSFILAPITLPGGTTEISDIFDVLEGGEDEGTVRYLLGFNGADVDSVSLLSGVDGFVGMEGVGVEKYVSDPLSINMTTTSAPTYIQPAGW